MVGFASPIQQAVKHVLKIDGERYFLATEEQARGLGVKRAWDVVRVPRQEADPRQEFEIALTTFNLGYGYSFASSPGVYERARGWDLSAPGKARTWPRLTTCEEVETTDYRGWLYYDQPSGYLYMFRGGYSTKYQPDDSSAEWEIVEYHYFGDDRAVCGKPATFDGKTYVPLIDTSTDTLANMQELDTISATSTEVQEITETGSPTGGTFTISYNDGITTSTTSALDFDATASEVQAALREFPGFQKVTVSRTGTTTNFVWAVTLTGVPSATTSTSPASMSTTDSLSGGTAPQTAVTVDTAGVGDQWDTSDIALRYFTVWNKPTVGPLLVGATANQIRTCATTPTSSSNWSTAQDVCDSTFNVTSLATWGRFLMCGTPNMLYSFDEQGTAVEELEEFKFIADDDNFVGMVSYGGYLLCPHKAGLIRWRPGSKQIVGAEQDGYLDGEIDSGFGRTSGLAPYGESCYQAIFDSFNNIGVVGELQAKAGARGPLTPHMHFEYQRGVEDCAVIGIRSAGAPSASVGTATDDNAVGTVAWSDPSNIESDDSTYASASSAGTTHYLKGLLDAGGRVPTGATVTGVKVTLRRASDGGSPTTFNYTGSAQTYDVPSGVTRLLVTLNGAQGGHSRGGLGAKVQAILTVTPLETLNLFVGQQPSSSDGGYNGGGNAGGGSASGRGGGGATDIRQGGTGLSDRVLVAGGGGGAPMGGGAATGGNGGENGTAGGSYVSSGTGASGGAGGTQSAGGAGGDGYGDGAPNGDGSGGAGSSGSGGVGAVASGGTGGYGGSGGGGGYYGGGGGGANASATGSGGGGGGGSSYDDPAVTESVTYTTGSNTGHGSITITPLADVVDATVRLVVGGSVVGDNKADTITKWGSGESTKEYGGSTDLWGTTITSAQANGSDVGFVVSATVTAGEARAYYATVSFYYGTSDVTPSFLGVITLSDDRATATPYIYKLPRFGLPAANDPNINKAISDADFYTPRYANPSRNVQKVYRSVEFYVDVAPEQNTPGFEMWAVVEDGAEFQLLDEAGSPATVTASGEYELFFPTNADSVGRWVQLKPVVPPLSAQQVPVAVDLRDITLHGDLLPKMTDEVTAVIYCGAGVHADGFKESRSGIQQLNDLTALYGPRESGAGPITLTDPETGEETHCVIGGEASRRIRYQQVSPGTYVTTIVLRKAVYQ